MSDLTSIGSMFLGVKHFLFAIQAAIHQHQQLILEVSNELSKPRLLKCTFQLGETEWKNDI